MFLLSALELPDSPDAADLQDFRAGTCGVLLVSGVCFAVFHSPSAALPWGDNGSDLQQRPPGWWLVVRVLNVYLVRNSICCGSKQAKFVVLRAVYVRFTAGRSHDTR